MAQRGWSGDDRWTTPLGDDEDDDATDLSAEIDLDALCLHAAGSHTYDGLTELERSVLCARFGLDGAVVRSMKELHTELDMTRHEVRDVLESALDKVRRHLAG